MAAVVAGTAAALFQLGPSITVVAAILVVGFPILGVFPYLVLAAYERGGWERARGMLKTELVWIAAVVILGVVVLGAVLWLGRRTG